ncbi:hypothetical protein O6H91_02G030900 [Diphasiastrum complanatum]|uniref:Uncharacterized protein n=1 Tax=Diphasiastrum complanatum TaxID=34168 RepID=A0ACC2EE90_DIPCM|nr:hypothetical protein O6H91_02G030900 [Diphasiastrum complanatum]
MLPSPCLPGQSSSSPAALFLPCSSGPSLAHGLPALLSNPKRFTRLSIHCSRASAEEQQQQLHLPKERLDGIKLTGAIFGDEKQLTGPRKLLEHVPATARFVTCAAIVAGAMAAGYAVGVRAKGTKIAAVGGALALGAVGGVAAYSINSAAPQVAAVKLHNALVNNPRPVSLQKQEVDEILSKYGVSKQNEHFNLELRELYDRFVSSVIPPGNEDLRGDEVEAIINFKNGLGLDDPDAAAVHIEIGRRIFRQRLETGDRDAAVEERRTFQKLVYVSTLVFGEASKFLLPWKRVFKVTDAQVEVAIRDNAQRLFQSKLSDIGADVDLNKMLELRETQLKLKLSDEVASELFRGHARKQLEEHITQASNVLKTRTRVKDMKIVVTELDKALAYNTSLGALSGMVEASKLPPGLGPVSLLGGSYESDRKMDDLKQLYRSYLTDAFSAESLEQEKVNALSQLKNIFGLGNREAESIMLDVTIKVYRRRLSQAVTGGELEAAPSKAVFLQNLCDSLHFDPENASKVHEEIYRQKLEQCVADGSLSDEDVSALLRLRILLCIPQETINAAHTDICGRIFAKVVDDAIAAGVDGYDAEMKMAVRNTATGLRLSQETAMTIASKAVRAIFLTYVKRSKTAISRTESARELKKLVIFNSLVVSQLLEDIKQESPLKEKQEEANVDADADEEDELEELQTLRKTRPAKNVDAVQERRAQKEITLKDDLELRDRTDLYRTYLLYCLSGETTGMPMGTQIVTQRDDSEFLRLGQLGSILGLNASEVADVHKGLAEQAFRQQAQVILADGRLSKARMQQLSELQESLGLPSESAQKVIKSITTTRISGAIESAVNQGRLTIEEVRELKEAGVDIDTTIAKGIREKLFRKIVDGAFSAGTGEFDEKEILDTIPKDLVLDVNKSKKMVEDLAKERLSSSLVQAVSLLRQKNTSGVVSSLNDLLTCDKVVRRSEPLTWSVQEELTDLFCIYVKSSPSEDKAIRLQELFGLDNATALKLREYVNSGGFSIGIEEEEFAF